MISWEQCEGCMVGAWEPALPGHRAGHLQRGNSLGCRWLVEGWEDRERAQEQYGQGLAKAGDLCWGQGF